jgi:peptidoglycan/LPS O-acetylase OafA/YrhL
MMMHLPYRKEIDGLRAVAVVPVVLFHAGVAGFAGGYVGVDVFFVISGYLITSLIRGRLQAGSFSLLRFYERRARRILPALSLVTFACVLPAWWWMAPEDLVRFGSSVAGVGGFISNAVFWRQSGYFGLAESESPLLHTWSLAVEEQFYLAFPLFMLIVWRWRGRWPVAVMAAAAVGSLALANWGAYRHPDAAFYLAPTRAWELLAGGLLAMTSLYAGAWARIPRWGHEALALGGLALIVLAVGIFNRATPHPSLYTLIPVSGTVLCIAAARPSTLTGRLLGARPLVGVGLISYSLYLWHQPLLAFSRLRSLEQPSPALTFAMVAASLVLSTLSWRLVESPFRRGRWLNRSGVFALALLALASLVAFGLFLRADDGHPDRLPPHLRTLQGQTAIATSPDLCQQLLPGGEPEACKGGHPALPATVALWGDSFADALHQAVPEALEGTQHRMVRMVYQSCPSITGVLRVAPGPAGAVLQERCARYTAEAAAALAADPMVMWVVIANAYLAYLDPAPGVAPLLVPPGAALGPEERRQQIRGQIEATVEALLGAGKRVVLVVNHAPFPEASARLLLREAQLGRIDAIPALTMPQAEYDARVAVIAALFVTLQQRHPGLVHLVDAREMLCEEALCDYAPAGSLMLADGSHLSLGGAAMLVPQLRAAFEAP